MAMPCHSKLVVHDKINIGCGLFSCEKSFRFLALDCGKQGTDHLFDNYPNIFLDIFYGIACVQDMTGFRCIDRAFDGALGMYVYFS